MSIHKPRTRILHVTFNMGYGGTEQVIRQLVNNLDPEAFECEIACIDGEVGAIGQSMQDSRGIPIHACKRGPGLDWATIRWLRALIKAGQFSVVHCHQYSPYTYGWFAHWGTGAKLVFTEHGRFHPDRHRKKARWLNPLIARTTAHVVAISSATRDALVEYEYMPTSQIQVIYNGISGVSTDHTRQETLKVSLGLNQSDRIIGTVARLDPVKNQALMIRATQLLRDAELPVKLLLVGDGPERLALEALCEQLNLTDAVIFAGFQTEPGDYLGLMDVFLLPSFTEGTSMTLLEAMSLGKPTVATRVGGTPEIVNHGETGLLVESDHLDDFRRAIERLLNDKSLYQQMSIAARQHYETQFTVQAMAEQYQRLY